ncbi:alpha/beta hydrolase family protein [Pseudonocardia asaccharolytica]|uniref:Alpha/beta hydrolase n=1 Tax=Pseudonocardia asaccharolytica DSM 44247 = NBRC 16224 TaxID=1123024 RepID=A0A511CVD5_9PSEU|nr:prolyl oligopeptidase family serine peptidase [Pseudonocardia asaccharolytica]GEL16407.1 alpha/beta hydrolase [Pseudonocardia asaccharolytica DSM 44247 = NBRC 16224]
MIRSEWVRTGLLGIGAGLGAGVLGVGWHYSSMLLDTRQRPAFPERVLAAADGRLTLARSRLVEQPGIWGLRWSDGLAVLGPVEQVRRDRVVRRLLAGPVPAAGTLTVLDTGPYDPDPGARGLVFTEVDVATPLGPAPAWWVPAPGDTWVVHVHGRGGARREALRILPALHRLGLPQLVISYRNDDCAPPSPDGHYHLGDTEWQDLQAAVRHARDAGARRIVLYAWSMGAAISGAFLDRAPEAAAVAAMIWDAPLLDWWATLRQQARNRRLPPALSPLAAAFARHRIGIDFDRFTLRTNPPAVRPPVLLIHSTDDTAVPVTVSRDLAAAAPALDWAVEYLEVPGVEHTAAWNADSQRYEDAVTAFLRSRLG